MKGQQQALDRGSILIKMLQVLANCEMAATRLLAPLLSLPEISFQDSNDLALIISDEARHGWLCRQKLLEIGGEAALPHAAAIEFLQPPNNLIKAFNRPLKTLADGVAFTAVMDLSADFLIGNFLDPQLRKLAKQLLADESRHIGFGWTRIPKSYLESPSQTEDLLAEWVELALDNFGRDYSRFDRLKLEYGLTRYPVARVKRSFAASVWGKIRKASEEASRITGEKVVILHPVVLNPYLKEFPAIRKRSAAVASA